MHLQKKRKKGSEKTTVIIQQGKIKVVAMPGAFVGANETEDLELMKAQHEYFKERPDVIRLIKRDENTLLDMFDMDDDENE